MESTQQNERSDRPNKRYQNYKNNRNNRPNRDEGGQPHSPNDNGQRKSGRGGYHRNPRNFEKNKPKTAKDFDKIIHERKDHGGVIMKGNKSDCLICCQPSDVFGISDCNHPVCMECCIRMRILGESKSCPQCRQPIDTLFFISAPNEWTNVVVIPKTEVKHKDSEKHGIKFTNDYTVEAYDGYMTHVCPICLKNKDRLEFPTFGALRHHVSNAHNRVYCTICYENLNILSKDRVTYTSDELRLHIDGKTEEILGQRGHPKCMFCDQKFFDDDYLYRHLRRDHFFCQICEADGQNIFYKKIDELYQHYKKKHHPCTDTECVALGIVFASDIELGVHRAAEHGSSTRNVNIDFQFSGRNLGNRILRSGDNRRRRTSPTNVSQPSVSLPVNSTIVPSAQTTQPRIVPSSTVTIVQSGQTKQQPQPKPAPSNSSSVNRSNFQSIVQDFPSLGQTSNSGLIPQSNWRQEVRAMRNTTTNSQKPVQVDSTEHFPSLLVNTSSSNGVKKQQNSIWAKGKPTALFSDNRFKQPANPSEQNRKKILPTPDIWPEGMRQRVEAKMKTGIDPGPSEPPPIDPLFKVEASKKAKRKDKKQKANQVAAGTKMADESTSISVSQSKFNALEEIDEGRKQSSSPPLELLHRTSDNFVRIESAPTLRSVAASIGTKKSDQKHICSTNASLETNSASASSGGPSNSNESNNYTSSYPSLTEIVTGLWPFAKEQKNVKSDQASDDNNKNAWTTAPPPGFSPS